jgi:transcriptional regulator with XRE-family HTH domain
LKTNTVIWLKMPGHVIKKYREMRNYSQKYVASKIGMSQNAYSKIENNITQLTVHHVKELSKILEVPITDLLNDDFEIHKPFTIPRTVSKSDLLVHVHNLQKMIEGKHALKHDSYIVVMSLVMAAEGSISSVH